MSKTHITDVTLRDAHQCLIATRLRTQDMLPICHKMDAVGYWAMEVWGGATFDACLRFLKEDPWERLRLLRQALPNTRLSMLLRGQNLLGYRPYSNEIVDRFIEQAAHNGVDVFRVFDALNDIQNISQAIKSIKLRKKHAQGAISFTISPVHTLEKFIDFGKQLAELGCDSIAIKDMAGLLTPDTAVKLSGALAKVTHLPIHLHTHATSGLAPMCQYAAIMAGCSHVDTAISAFSGGASHPATESLVAALQQTSFSTDLNLHLLLEINDYFKKIRKKYSAFESEAQAIDPRIQHYQIPGGMISNLSNQLKEQHALDKLAAVQEEIFLVRKDLGYPPLVTPTSQIVGTQAVLNVLTGKRYQTITNEVLLYCQGKYGSAPAPIAEQLLAKAREAAALSPKEAPVKGFAELQEAIMAFSPTTEDILSYAMLPDTALSFFKDRKAGILAVSEPILDNKNSVNVNFDTSMFEVSLHGKAYQINIAGITNTKEDTSTCFLSVDGIPNEVKIRRLVQTSQEGKENTPQVPAIAKNMEVVCVAMPGTVISVNVSLGEEVSEGQVLLIVEAMKMETEIQATVSGKIEAVFCQKGDKVTPQHALLHIRKENK